MSQLSTLLSGLATAQVAMGVIRPNGVGDGINLIDWRQSGYAPRSALALIEGDQALTIDSPTGGANGAEIWGLILGKWKLAGYLNNGSKVVVAGALLGYVQELDDLAAFTRMLICGTPNIGAPTYGFCPMETWIR